MLHQLELEGEGLGCKAKIGPVGGDHRCAADMGRDLLIGRRDSLPIDSLFRHRSLSLARRRDARRALPAILYIEIGRSDADYPPPDRAGPSPSFASMARSCIVVTTMQYSSLRLARDIAWTSAAVRGVPW